MQRKAHNKFTSSMLPGVPLKLINSVNAALDKPSSWAGPSHRKYLHDPITASVVGSSVALKMGYPAWMGVAVASAHLIEDRISDSMVQVKLSKNFTAKKLFDMLTA